MGFNSAFKGLTTNCYEHSEYVKPVRPSIC